MADKLKMQTENIADKNYEILSKMFPNALTETITGYDDDGKPIVERAIDADVLRQEISCKVVEGKDERYQFTWPDKKKAVLLANTPLNKTLRPVRADEATPTGADNEGKPYCSSGSVDFDNTENLYIEGDNLEVLKLLHETYLGKVKMIYIDPPYNTGNDFVYEDDFAQSMEEYRDRSGQFDDNGNRMVQNIESNGRFHTDWLNMISPRLKLAKDLLSDEGVIFISIGEEELFNLKLVCDEIFGIKNYVSNVTRIAKTASNMGSFFASSTDYILCYAKNINDLPSFKGEVNEDLYKKIETEGKYKGEKYRDDIAFFQSGLKHGGSRYPIFCPDGQRVNTPDNKPWRANEKTFLDWKKEGKIVFKKTSTSPLVDEDTGEQARWNLYTKSYLFERQEKGTQPRNILTEFINRKGADLIKTFGITFDFAKPVELMDFLLKIVNDKNCIVLDFFSGSATMAHAVMKCNVEDGGKRKFIMVQLPEAINEKSETYKAGYKNICEIGKERIRRASKKIAEKYPNSIFDRGFRVLKCDSSNMKDIYHNPSEVQQTLFDTYVDNIKEERTPEDLLFQVMLDLGVLLSSKIEETTIAGKQVFNVADGFLIACFDNDVTEETVKAVAEKKPYYAVFRDSSMANDSVATNFDQIFASISPDTVRKVL